MAGVALAAVVMGGGGEAARLASRAESARARAAFHAESRDRDRLALAAESRTLAEYRRRTIDPAGRDAWAHWSRHAEDVITESEGGSLRLTILLGRRARYHDRRERDFLEAATRPWRAVPFEPPPSWDSIRAELLPAVLGQHRGLHWLNLHDIAAEDSTLAALAGRRDLESLDLSGTDVTDAGLVHLRGLPALSRLVLARTRVTDRGLATLRDLPGLASLDLSATRVSPRAVASFRRDRPGVSIRLKDEG
jgi:hypothetical protein